MKLTKKQIWQIVGACVLCAVLVFGLIVGMYFSLDSLNKLTDTPTASVEESSPIVIECENTSPILLSAVSIVDSSATGTSVATQIITATVEPASASGLNYNWSVAWKNPNSTWANGKKVTDYVIVAPYPGNALKSTVTCNQAFGEQVIVTIACADFDISASATVDYTKRLTNYSIGFRDQSGNSVITFDDTLTGEDYARSQTNVVWGTDSLDASRLDDLYVFKNLTYGVGTIADDNAYVTITFADGVEHRLSSVVFDPQSVDSDFGYSGKICNTPVTIAFYYMDQKVADWQFALTEKPTSLSLDETSLVF